MLIHEAAILAQTLDMIRPASILDIGSGTRAGREIIQPHIAAAFNGHKVHWTDMDPGFSGIKCDITKRETLKDLPVCEMVTACSILEHVEDIDAAIENIRSLVTKWLIVSVPYSYPEHHCPIDNMWRPSPAELRDRILGDNMADFLTCQTNPEIFCSVNNASVSFVVATKLVSPTGFWLEQLPTGELFDESLAVTIADCVDSQLIDFGCGRGSYVSFLRDAGIDAIGIDGNPTTEGIPHCHISDLTTPLNGKFDQAEWVLCLEVGEHIPPVYCDTFCDNIAKLAKKGAIISWSSPGWPGIGHVNCREVLWVVDQMMKRGLLLDNDLTNRLRSSATLPYFKENLVAFRVTDK